MLGDAVSMYKYVDMSSSIKINVISGPIGFLHLYGCQEIVTETFDQQLPLYADLN